MATFLPFLTSFNILMNISRNFLNFCVNQSSDACCYWFVFAFCDLKIIINYIYTPIRFQPSLKKLILCACLNQDRTPKEFTAVALCTMTRDLTREETKVWLSQTPSEILIALSGFYNHTPVVIFRTLKSENLIGHTQNLITWTRGKKRTQLCF